MMYIFTKKTYADGLVQIVVEAETAPGSRTVIGVRGVPPALVHDAGYLESLKQVALKEILAEIATGAAPGESSLGVIED